MAVLNEFQALNCNSNVYFFKWDDRDRARIACDAVDSRRVQARVTLRVFLQTYAAEGSEQYRLATEEEKTGKGPFMINSIAQFPEPPRWPSFLRFRPAIRAFSNGSMIGYVRKREWLRGVQK